MWDKRIGPPCKYFHFCLYVSSMLQELSIRNFAIIDDLHIHLSNGLTILTGETGAGKSIIIDAVNLLLGSRASSRLIRTGAETAELEALFEVADLVVVGTVDKVSALADPTAIGVPVHFDNKQGAKTGELPACRPTLRFQWYLPDRGHRAS